MCVERVFLFIFKKSLFIEILLRDILFFSIFTLCVCIGNIFVIILQLCVFVSDTQYSFNTSMCY